MKKIIYKKTFLMNVAMSVLYILGAIFFFFLNIDYVEVRLPEKVFNLIVLFTPILTAIALYKNNLANFCKAAFVFNIFVLIAYLLLSLRAIYHREIDSIIVLSLFVAPFILNVAKLKSLMKLEVTT